MAFVQCNQRNLFKPIQVMFSEYYIQMDVDDYIWDVSGDGSACVILIG
jgi:hypothetical protein